MGMSVGMKIGSKFPGAPLAHPLNLLQRLAWTAAQTVRGRPTDTQEERLIQWVRRHGGQADVSVGYASEGAPRGVLAERSFAPDEVIISLPKQLAIPFEGTPEEACILLLHIKHDQQKQQHYRPWLNTLPGPEDFIAWDHLDDETLSQLQCPELEDALRLRRQWLEAVWHGSTEHTAAYSRDQLLSSYAISMDEVQWAANVVRSRNWTVGRTEDGSPLGVMKPLMDMVNHDRASPNRMRYNGEAFQLVHEGQGIQVGEEITYSYEGPQHDLRNDQAAIDYSFMLPFEQDSRLFHIDALSSSDSDEQDCLEDAPSSQLEQERARLEAVLAGFPTTQAEDRELIARRKLDSLGYAETFMMEIRAARKAAIVARMTELSVTLSMR